MFNNYQHGKKPDLYNLLTFHGVNIPQSGLFQTTNLWEHAVMQYFLHSDTTDINSRTQIVIVIVK